jgi:hypothetical protein
MIWRQQKESDAAAEAQRRTEREGKRGVGIPPDMLGWLRHLLPVRSQAAPRLQVLERISLAPRHTLALVESEGRRFLIATSPEGAPVFHSLDDRTALDRFRPAMSGQNAARPSARAEIRRAPQTSGRVSW